MARFIHLNGPPGIGKSTLAQRYVDQHAGVLNLDIDRLRGLIGRAQDRFEETGEIVRPLALSMAATHLSAGYDVIMPQFLGRLGEIERFEALAKDCGAVFREIVLMDSLERSLERFARRDLNDDAPWHREVKKVVQLHGGPALLADMHDQLTALLQTRPSATVLSSREGGIQQDYDALITFLNADSPE